MGIRVTFITVMPSPYSLDLFAALEADRRLKLSVLYLEMAAPDTHWGTVPLPSSARVLAGGWHNLAGGRIHWNSGAISALKETQPEIVVVAGYSSLTTQVVMRWLRWHGIPWIFWGEIPGMRQLSGLKQRLRSLARYPAVTWPDAIAAIGSRAEVEYRRLARRDCEVANIPYFTDLSAFMSSHLAQSEGGLNFLYCGQLIARKGVDVLLDAFLSFAAEIPGATLQLVGEGPLREELAARVPEEFRPRVIFSGFQPVEQLPKFFAAADVFVLPSRHDGWGVVVNQALGAGLPIICTEAVGAAHDLVTPHWNGMIVPAANVSALAEAMRCLASDSETRQQYALNSRHRAAEWTPQCGADRWVDLIDRVLTRRQAKSRPQDGRHRPVSAPQDRQEP